MRIFVIAVFALLAVACTEKSRAKNWGGSYVEKVDNCEKVVTVTWKGDNMWILTRPMRAEDTVERYSFVEDSSWGNMEGKVTLQERCDWKTKK